MDFLQYDLDLRIQTIDVSESPAGITITTRKTKASGNAVASAQAKTVIRPRSGGRRALGVASSVAKRGYRPDLRTVSLDPYLDSTCIYFAFYSPQYLFSFGRILVRTHWIHLAVNEGWAWTCLQDKSLSIEADQTSLECTPCRYRTPLTVSGYTDTMVPTSFVLHLLLFAFVPTSLPCQSLHVTEYSSSIFLRPSSLASLPSPPHKRSPRPHHPRRSVATRPSRHKHVVSHCMYPYNHTTYDMPFSSTRRLDFNGYSVQLRSRQTLEFSAQLSSITPWLRSRSSFPPAVRFEPLQTT